MCIHDSYLRAPKDSFVWWRYKELKEEVARIDICKNRLTPSKIQSLFKIEFKQAKAFIEITKDLMEKYKRFLICSKYSEQYVMDETYCQDYYWKKYLKMKRRHYTKLLLMLPTVYQDEWGQLLITI